MIFPDTKPGDLVVYTNRYTKTMAILTVTRVTETKICVKTKKAEHSFSRRTGFSICDTMPSFVEPYTEERAAKAERLLRVRRLVTAIYNASGFVVEKFERRLDNETIDHALVVMEDLVEKLQGERS